MRFLLLEKVPSVPTELVKQWDANNPKDITDPEAPETNQYTRSTILDMIIEDAGWGLEGQDKEEVKASLYKSCVSWTADPRKNKFIPFLDKFFSKMDLMADSDRYFGPLMDLGTRYRMSFDEDFLFNSSLYDRTPEEFEYTLKLLNTVNSPSEMRRYFQDVSKVNPEDLYNGNVIKPVGDPNKDEYNEDTLYGVVETWADHGNNDAPPEEKVDGRRKKVDAAIKSVDFDEVRKTSSYDSMDMLPKSEEQEGNIVYVQNLFLDASNGYKGAGGEAFLQFRDGQWTPIKVNSR